MGTRLVYTGSSLAVCMVIGQVFVLPGWAQSQVVRLALTRMLALRFLLAEPNYSWLYTALLVEVQ